VTWLVGAGFVILVAVGFRQMREANIERTAVLTQEEGHELTLVRSVSRAFTRRTTGTIGEVRRGVVTMEARGKQIAIPVGAIQELWRGDVSLGHW
jgi:hypothetical protein